jgi:hypothetical protein
MVSYRTRQHFYYQGCFLVKIAVKEVEDDYMSHYEQEESYVTHTQKERDAPHTNGTRFIILDQL